MAIQIFKYLEYVARDASGVGVNHGGGGAASVDLSGFYTKIDLQTPGLAQVDFANIVNAYHNDLLGLQGGEEYSDSAPPDSDDSSGVPDVIHEYYHLDEMNYVRLINLTFIDSLVEESDFVVHLDGDIFNPGTNMYYGTDITGVKGWYELPEAYLDSSGNPIGGDMYWEEISDGLLTTIASAQTVAVDDLIIYNVPPADSLITQALMYDPITGQVYYGEGGSGVIPNDNILDWDEGNDWYAPYAAKADGKFYSGTDWPTNVTRLNYDGYFYANKFYAYTEISIGTSTPGSGLTLGTYTLDVQYNSGALLTFMPVLSDTSNSLAYMFDTSVELTYTEARLMSVRNAGVEKFYIDKDGEAYANGVHLGVQGVQGTQGLQGVQGLDGQFAAQGVQGISGYQQIYVQDEPPPSPNEGDIWIDSDGATNAQGPSGPQGESASMQGATGIQGDPGGQGAQGIQGLGSQGEIGAQGTTGAGTQGETGGQGAQGIQGISSQGTQGIQGISNQGTQGAGGTQGTDGGQGTQGIQGLGSQGETGSQGTQGISSQGVQGVQGISSQGAQGIQGISVQGSQGETGSQGTDGTQGATGAGSQGTDGTQGATGSGSQGAQGTQGISSQGAQGSQGGQGATGAGTQGETGTQGTDGSQGTTGSGTQGETGGQGTQGIQGISSQGAQGTQGISSQGAQGIQGISSQGTQGTQGISSQGAQGTQGISSQGSQGTQGISSQGAQGTQGISSQGAQGTQGISSQGSQGTQGISSQGAQGGTGSQGATGTQGSITAIDSTPDSDHVADGLKTVLTAGAAIAYGEVCYMGSDAKMELGDADAVASSGCWAMCVDAAGIAENSTGNFLLVGVARHDAWNWTTLGGFVYLDTATPGGMTQTPPSATDDVIQILGIAIHADYVYFNPQLVMVEHT